jgi:hypothetical protein
MTPGSYNSYVNITTNSTWGAYRFEFTILPTPVVIQEVRYNMSGENLSDLNLEQLMRIWEAFGNDSYRKLQEYQAIKDKEVQKEIVEKNVTVLEPVLLREMDQHIVKLCVETNEALMGKVNADLEERNMLRRDLGVCQGHGLDKDAMIVGLNDTIVNITLEHQAMMELSNATLYANNYVLDRRKTRIIFWTTLISITFVSGLVVAWKLSHPYSGNIIKWW